MQLKINTGPLVFMVVEVLLLKIFVQSFSHDDAVLPSSLREKSTNLVIRQGSTPNVF